VLCCEGRGGKAGAVEKCSTCRGTGVQVRVQQLGPGFIQQVQSMCSECEGQGERINPKDRCKDCQGRKITRERKVLEVHIDKGTGGIWEHISLCGLSLNASFHNTTELLKLNSVQLVVSRLTCPSWTLKLLREHVGHVI